MKVAAGLVLAIGMAAALAAGQATHAVAADQQIAVVAAENFYGDIARQVGGDRVAVVSILSSPDQDPHLFETTPAVVRQLANAQIVILNGANYDPWMDKLLTCQRHAPDASSSTLRNSADGSRATTRMCGTTRRPCPRRQSPLPMHCQSSTVAHASDYAARLKVTLASLARIDTTHCAA